MALDNRLREALGFVVFKTYDKYLDKEKVNSEIKQTLKKMKYQSVVCCRYFYRRLAVVVDCEDKYTLLYSDKDSTIQNIPFDYVTGEDLYKKQFNQLIDYLVKNVDLSEKKWYLHGKLLLEIDNMKKTEKFVRVDKSDFEPIMILAKTVYKDNLDAQEGLITDSKEIESLEKIRKKEIYAQVVYLRDTKRLTFKEIGVLMRSSESTAFKRYNKAIILQENKYNALKINESEKTSSLQNFS